MSAVNNHSSSAMRVFTTPWLNEHLLSFMDIDDLEWMKLVSKKIPRQPIDNIVRSRLLIALDRETGITAGWHPTTGELVTKLGKDVLNGITIRNFPSLVRPPLSNLPMGHMAGFEQISPGAFTPYIFSRRGVFLEARCSCLSNWTGFRGSFFQGDPNNNAQSEIIAQIFGLKRPFSDIDYLRDDRGVLVQNEDDGCCDFPSAHNGCWNAFKRCCGPIVLVTCLCCCYNKEPKWTATWEQLVRANTPHRADAQGPKPQVMN